MPVLVRALVTGFAVAAAGTLPWAVMVSVNLRMNPAVPWSVAAMAIYLAVYWFYVSGGGWPRSTREFRRRHLRAAPLTAAAWNLALFTSVCGLLFALVFLLGIYVRLVDVPKEAFPSTEGVAWYVVVGYIAMLAVVAGVAEEAGYRGYLQSQLEEAYGPFAAIAITSVLFAFAHFTPVLLPFFILVAILFGLVAYFSGSILPCILAHAGYDFVMTLLVWQYGSPSVPDIDLRAGVDATFVAAGVIASLSGLASLWGLLNLRDAVRADS